MFSTALGESVLEDYNVKVLNFSAFSTFAVLTLSTHTHVPNCSEVIIHHYDIYFANTGMASLLGLILHSLYSLVCYINIASQNKEKKYVLIFVKLLKTKTCFSTFKLQPLLTGSNVR